MKADPETAILLLSGDITHVVNGTEALSTTPYPSRVRLLALLFKVFSDYREVVPAQYDLQYIDDTISSTSSPDDSSTDSEHWRGGNSLLKPPGEA